MTRTKNITLKQTSLRYSVSKADEARLSEVNSQWNRDLVVAECNPLSTFRGHGPLKAISIINNHGVKGDVAFYAQRRKYTSEYEWIIWYARSGEMMPYYSANLDDAVRNAYQHAYLMA